MAPKKSIKKKSNRNQKRSNNEMINLSTLRDPFYQHYLPKSKKVPVRLPDGGIGRYPRSFEIMTTHNQAPASGMDEDAPAQNPTDPTFIIDLRPSLFLALLITDDGVDTQHAIAENLVSSQIESWRLCSMGMRIKFVGNHDDCQGNWEACRFKETFFDADTLMTDDASYCCGSVRQLGEEQFELHPTSTNLLNDFEKLRTDFDENHPEWVLHSQWDNIRVKISNMKPGTTVQIHVVGHYEFQLKLPSLLLPYESPGLMDEYGLSSVNRTIKSHIKAARKPTPLRLAKV